MKLLIFLSSLMTLTAQANIKWLNDKVTEDVDSTTKAIKAVYKFKNEGKDPIHIKNVSTSCGCTTVKLDKKVYNPGESGEIVASMEMQAKTGVQRKFIYVRSNDTDNPVQKLTIEAVFPVYLTIDNKYLKWKHTEDKKEKVMTITISDKYDVKLTKITSSNPEFKAKLIKINDKKYEVRVTPPDTDKPKRSLLKLYSDYPKKSPQMYQLSARISIPIPL